MSEHNLIQAPELLRRLASRLGMRQMHISPALTEGITPVIIVDDISEPGSGPAITRRTLLGQVTSVGNGSTTYGACFLWNPAGGTRVCRVRRITVGVTASVVGSFRLVLYPIASAPSGNAGVSYWQDMRLAGTAAGRVMEMPLSAGQLGTFHGAYNWSGAGQMIVEPANMVLPPGTAVCMANVTGFSNGLSVVFEWDEEEAAF